MPRLFARIINKHYPALLSVSTTPQPSSKIMIPTEIAQAANQVINDTTAEQAAISAQAQAPAQEPQEPLFKVSGVAFYNVCVYVGTLPLRQVIGLRKGLWELQREQQCINPNNLAPVVTLGQKNIDILMNFLADQPCDAVFDILQAFEKSVMDFAREAEEQAMREAAAKAIDDVQQNPPPADDAIEVQATEVPAAS